MSPSIHWFGNTPMHDDEPLRFDLAVDRCDQYLTILSCRETHYLDRGERVTRLALQEALDKDGPLAVGEMASAMLWAMCDVFLSAYGPRRALLAFAEALRLNVHFLRREYRKALQ